MERRDTAFNNGNIATTSFCDEKLLFTMFSTWSGHVNIMDYGDTFNVFELWPWHGRSLQAYCLFYLVLPRVQALHFVFLVSVSIATVFVWFPLLLLSLLVLHATTSIAAARWYNGVWVVRAEPYIKLNLLRLRHFPGFVDQCGRNIP
jgi:hypothetical protein